MTPLQTRIQNLQRKVKAPLTGEFDATTTNTFLSFFNIVAPAQADLKTKKELIQKQVGLTGKDADGLIGPMTITRLESFFSTELPALPSGGSLVASKKALDIIIESEVSSKAIYEKKYKTPVVPGESSGVTIGIGYDIGHVSIPTFTNDWQAFLPAAAFNLLKAAVGKKQNAAKLALTPQLKAVSIEWNTALEVFYNRSMPAWAKKARKMYPGLEKLPPDAQGAIISLVYNRGESLADKDGRREMRNLVGLIAGGNLKQIAGEIRKMKRLWSLSESPGLHKRRDREADLVENANFLMLPDEYIVL